MKNPFTKILIKDKREDIFHSSAYAKAQSGGVMGAASVESFEKRRKIDQNRQVIQKYKDSQVANQRFAPRPCGMKTETGVAGGVKRAAGPAGAAGMAKSATGPAGGVRRAAQPRKPSFTRNRTR